MKTAIIFFLLGFIAGIFGYRAYLTRGEEHWASVPASTPNAEHLASRAKEAAHDAKDSFTDKMVEWHLTPDDIKADLARTGEVVRSSAKTAGEKISDARVVTVIKAKYVLDRDLSALDIAVDARDGKVLLTGFVAAPDLIGKAVALALDTEGVHDVISRLTVKKYNSADAALRHESPRAPVDASRP